jgi:membrane protein
MSHESSGPVLKTLRSSLLGACEWINGHTGGSLTVLLMAFQRFSHVRGAEASASIAYYALFSLFPLLLLLVAVLGFVLVTIPSPGQVVGFIAQALPISRSFLEENLTQILQNRGASGVLGLIGLFWSASSVFLTLSRNINRAWPMASARNFFQGRLVALAMVLILTVLLIMSVLISSLFSLLPLLEIPILGSVSIYDTLLWRFLRRLVPWVFAFLIFIGMYRWLPNTHVRWREAFWGALAATITWELLLWGFSRFISSGIVRYELVYGSLGTLIGLMIWIYLSSSIVLLGAHISASIAHTSRLRDGGMSDCEVLEGLLG